MFLIFDVIAVVIFVFTVISCRNKGFMSSFLGTIKVALAIVISYVFMPTVSYYFRTGFVEKLITGSVTDRLHSLASSAQEGFNLEKLFADMPTEFGDILTRYGADADTLSERFGNMTEAAENNLTDLAQTITYPVVKSVSNILAYAALFVGSLIILSIVIKIIGLVMKLPVLKGIDRTLGLVFGVISGALLVWVYCNLVAFTINSISIVKPGLIGTNVFENTYIIKFVCEKYGFGFAAK